MNSIQEIVKRIMDPQRKDTIPLSLALLYDELVQEALLVYMIRYSTAFTAKDVGKLTSCYVEWYADHNRWYLVITEKNGIEIVAYGLIAAAARAPSLHASAIGRKLKVFKADHILRLASDPRYKEQDVPQEWWTVRTMKELEIGATL